MSHVSKVCSSGLLMVVSKSLNRYRALTGPYHKSGPGRSPRNGDVTCRSSSSMLGLPSSFVVVWMSRIAEEMASHQENLGHCDEQLARMGWVGLLVVDCQLRWVLAVQFGLCVLVVSLVVLGRDGYLPLSVSGRSLDGAGGCAQRCVTIVPLRQDNSQHGNNIAQAWSVHRKLSYVARVPILPLVSR